MKKEDYKTTATSPRGYEILRRVKFLSGLTQAQIIEKALDFWERSEEFKGLKR